MRARSAAPRPATRTMKNSSRLAAEIERNLIRSKSGWPRLADSSNTRRLKFSQDNSRLMKRSGLDTRSDARWPSSGRRGEPDSKATTVAWPRSAMAVWCSSRAMFAMLRYNPMTLVTPQIRRWGGAPSSLSPAMDRRTSLAILLRLSLNDIYHWYLSSRLANGRNRHRQNLQARPQPGGPAAEGIPLARQGSPDSPDGARRAVGADKPRLGNDAGHFRENRPLWRRRFPAGRTSGTAANADRRS